MNEYTYQMYLMSGMGGLVNMLEYLEQKTPPVSAGMCQEMEGFVKRLSAINDAWQKRWANEVTVEDK